nr:phage holin family protein [Cellulomonas fimi]
MLAEVSRDLSTLMRQEMELAKAELKQSATQAGKGAGMFTGAAVAGHMVLLFLSLTLMWWLGDALDHWAWGALIVAVLWGIAAAVLAMRGKKEMKEVRGIPDTTATVKKIPDALKPDEEARR